MSEAKPQIEPNLRGLLKLELVSVDDLQIDAGYQRSRDKVSDNIARVIAENFNVFLCGPLYVGRRKDKSLWVIDGQARLLALKELSYNSWPCLVINTTAVQEAQMFTDLNAVRRAVSAPERFKAKLFHNDPQTVEIQRLAQQFGLTLVPNTEGILVKAVTTVERLHKSGLLPETLSLLRLWNIENADELSIGGIGAFLKFGMHRKQFVMDRAVAVLQAHSFEETAAKARSIRVMTGGMARTAAMRDALVYYYNLGLTEKRRLPVSGVSR